MAMTTPVTEAPEESGGGFDEESSGLPSEGGGDDDDDEPLDGFPIVYGHRPKHGGAATLGCTNHAD
jgi:hypothetical protein